MESSSSSRHHRRIAIIVVFAVVVGVFCNIVGNLITRASDHAFRNRRDSVAATLSAQAAVAVALLIVAGVLAIMYKTDVV